MRGKYAMMAALLAVYGMLPGSESRRKFNRIRAKGLSAEEMGTAGSRKRRTRRRRGGKR